MKDNTDDGRGLVVLSLQIRQVLCNLCMLVASQVTLQSQCGRAESGTCEALKRRCRCRCR